MENTQDSFEHLVAGLTSEERTFLFQKIKGSIENDKESLVFDQSADNFAIKDLEKDDFIRISELYSLEYIGYSGNPNGFIGSFFRLYAAIDGHNYPVTRIGFKNPDKQRNVLNCYCQIEGSSIYMFGITKTLFYILEFLNTSFDCSVVSLLNSFSFFTSS